MAWLIILVALALDAIVAFVLHRELPRWRGGEKAFALVAPLRLLVGLLLMVLILLLGVGVAFVLPNPGTGKLPSAEMVTFWLFIGLLVGAIFLLTLLDMMLVRRGFQRRQDEVFAEVLLGRAQRDREQGEGEGVKG